MSFRKRRAYVPEIQITPGFCLLAGWFAASNGWTPLFMILSAAVIHECGHMAALWACGAQVTKLRIGIFGALMESDAVRLSYGREIFCTAAGPMANFLTAWILCIFGNPYPALTGVHVILCCFNLLPVRPLDGGRILELITAWTFGPRRGDMAARAAGCLTAGMLSCTLFRIVWQSGGSFWLIPPAMAMAWAAVREYRGTAG